MVRLHMLRSLQDVMKAGEELIELNREAAQDASDQVQGGRAEDASVAGAVLQEYVPLLLELLLGNSSSARKESLALLGILLQQVPNAL